MKLIKYPSKEQWTELLKRPALNTESLFDTVRSIINKVRTEGDKAVLEYEAAFDKVTLSALAVTPEEVQAAGTLVNDELKAAISLAKQNIETFHSSQRFVGKKVETMNGVTCWQKSVGIEKVDRSAINALILGGAVPVYVNPGVNKELGIPLGMTVEDVEKAILENPDAKAVFVNNPTYYGVCSDIKKIADLAHAHGMYLLADEAHGTHFYFGDNMPLAGMKAGADFAAVSMHKSGGSLTQSSFLLTADTVNEGYVRQIINLMQTTSGSYLLMSSLDISRRNLALHGREIFAKVQSYAQYMRDEINEIGGYYAFSKELCDGGAFYDFDVTKLSIHTRDIGLAGIEVYDILRDRYGIQIEFGDIGNILAYVSIGDRELYLDRLIGALNDIKRIYSKDKTGMLDHEYINPIVKLSPQDAFYGNKKSVPIEQSSGKISGEFVMCYPPGIPILAPGEQITDEILAYIKYAGDKGCFLTGTQDLEIKNIMILDE